jgi:hypothetical protein
MKERPIIMCAEMVRATLEGRKTQTRRTKGLEEINKNPDEWIFIGKNESYNRWYFTHRHKKENHIIHCPCGQVGDRLWVRETWRIGAWDEDYEHIAIDYETDNYARREWLTIPDDYSGGKFLKYWQQSCEDCVKAGRDTDENGKYHWQPGQSPCRWRSSRFMPRWASRIILGITDERVERVQNINSADMYREGISMDGALAEFIKLWDSLNAKRGYGWGKNPWVWVIEFRRIKP